MTLFNLGPLWRIRREIPGSKERGGCSEEVAAKIKPTVAMAHASILKLLADAEDHGLTSDEIAECMGWKVLSTRPRVSELFGFGKIVKTPHRRPSSNGHSSAVWRVA